MSISLLIVEDDKNVQKLLQIACIEYNYRYEIVDTLALAHQYLANKEFDAVVLDLGLPDGDGKAFIAHTRNISNIPIIVLSARNGDHEIIQSLDLGADDYLTKPFSTSELLARIRAVTRRNPIHLDEDNSSILICKTLQMNLTTRVVTLNNKEHKLTPTEYKLLRFLLKNSNKTVTHNQILKEVWGVGYQQQMQYLRTYINTLRKKIELDSTNPEFIITLPSVGYRLCCDTKEPL